MEKKDTHSSDYYYYTTIHIMQGVKVRTLGSQNERNFGYYRLAGSHFCSWFVFYVSLPNQMKLLLLKLSNRIAYFLPHAEVDTVFVYHCLISLEQKQIYNNK